MAENISRQISKHPSNRHFTELGYLPLFCFSPTCKIVIVGQAPGRKAQESGQVWNDASGKRLIKWLGVNEETFRDESLFSHLPMDFFYPGKGAAGDLPPRRDFAQLWHQKILRQMPKVELTLLIGSYAQQFYLEESRMKTLTETVRNFSIYTPKYFPLVHPSPLNFRWLNKNTWYEQEIIPKLQNYISQIINI